MDKSVLDRRVTDQGVTSVQFLLAAVLALYLFVAFVNLIAVQYGRGSMRSAVEQAARWGAMTGSAEQCEVLGAEVVEQLFGGRMMAGTSFRCGLVGSTWRAESTAVFESWTPLMPDISVGISASAVTEP